MQNTANQMAAIARIEAMTPAQKDALMQRWEKYIVPDPFGGCWLWSGKLHSWGYGLFTIAIPGNNQFTLRAHRFSIYLKTGRMPASSEFVCHRCDVPACVNPAHLFLGTNQDNVNDCIRKGRQRYGTSPKLTPEIVRYIRTSSETPTKLARRFGVGRRHVHKIREGITWAHLA